MTNPFIELHGQNIVLLHVCVCVCVCVSFIGGVQQCVWIFGKLYRECSTILCVGEWLKIKGVL